MTSMYPERNANSEPVRNDASERTGSFCAPKALVVGLTGGIASGKSTVAGMLADLGARVLSADAIVHRLLREDAAVRSEIANEFGSSVVAPTGEIDRKALGEVIFRSAEKRRRLEAIIHPHVIAELAHEAEDFRRIGQGVLVMEIPLLLEVGAQNIVDKVLVVVAEQDTQIQRLEKRNSVSREEAMLRIGAQMPLTEKVKHADWVVSTDGTLRSTKEQVYKVWTDIQKSLAQPK